MLPKPTMLDSIAEPLALACPLAITCASVVVADRIRERRRRELLNRALHELRRPLQALVLQARRVRRPNGAAAISSSRRSRRWPGSTVRSTASRRRDARRSSTAGRWRPRRSGAGESPPRSRAARSSSPGAPTARASNATRRRSRAALDNLIANALEHGSGPIRIDGSERAGRLRLTVADGVDAGGRA